MRLAAAAALAGLAAFAACFDGEELTEGLRCEQDSHCGGSLKCLGGVCADPDCASGGTSDCDSTADATTVSTTVSMSTTVGATCASLGESCANGEACCEGQCIDDGTGSLACRQTCYAGTECADSCCCAAIPTGYNVCVPTDSCGADAACPGPGCASAGSLCGSDLDCCAGRCLPNAASTHSCFKTCTAPSDCASGCCNYKAEFATSICEVC